ncbi:MAG TPA: hypothetical protein DCZ94_04130 [Lentisphaeria bacterium]|nr:MAG: hypothetical protein A2X48_05350 [Lentisphaerae bacterium GWF2_49_21]HBC86124.1 hypothetical protein [Lentisphaeria bacterium]
MKTMKLLLVPALALVIFIPACYSPVNTVENTDKTMEKDFVRNKRVVTDETLSDRLQIVSVDKQEITGGLMKVQVTFKNARKSDYKFAYRFQWFNESGMEVATASTTWIEKFVYGGEEFFLSAVSPNERCKDFKLMTRALD